MFFKKKNKETIEVRLADQEFGEGSLNTGSLTWAFMRTWATNELNKARKSNDNVQKDEIQTATLRGRIKLLKEILALPKQSDKRGLLRG